MARDMLQIRIVEDQPRDVCHLEVNLELKRHAIRLQPPESPFRRVFREEGLREATSRRSGARGVPAARVGELGAAEALREGAPVGLALAGDAEVGAAGAAIAAAGGGGVHSSRR